MHFAPTEEESELRGAVHDLLRGACPPAVVRAAWEVRPTGLWPLLAECGVLGIDLPTEAGGLGLSPTAWVGVLEEAGRFAAPVPLVEAIAAAGWLVDSGRPDVAAEVATGQKLVTVGVVDGLVRDADVADLILLVQGDQVWEVRDARVERAPCVDGAVHLFRVVGGRRSAVPGDGRLLLDRAAVAAAATLLGLGERMLEMAVEHARQRRQFGRAIGSFQAVQHHLVDALLELGFAAPMVAAAAWALAVDLPTRAREVSGAKAMASDAAWLAARASLQAHGAIGYTVEYDLHLWMKRAWVLASTWGSAAEHRERAAIDLLDRPSSDSPSDRLD